jgi:hypothetical protein
MMMAIGDSAAKKAPLAVGPSMADLRGGNSLDGLGIHFIIDIHSFTHLLPDYLTHLIYVSNN